MRFLQAVERAGREVSAVALENVFSVEKVQLAELQRALDRGEIRKILLVRNYQGLGDLLCTTPAIRALKLKCPGATIHFLANTFNQAALQNNPNIAKIWAWDERRKADPRQWLSFRARLRAERYDLALVLSGNALSLTAILLADLSGARWVIGYNTSSYGQSWGSRLYSYQVPVPSAVREVDRFAGLVEGLGIPCLDRSPEFFVSPEQKAFADAFWSDQMGKAKSPVIGIFLGGKVDRPDRIWPAKNFAQVARRLQDAAGATVLAIAPPVSQPNAAHRRETTFWMDEDIHVQEFLKTFGEGCPIFRDRELGRVGEILQKLNLFLCPDGGLMHLAAALKVPTLTLFFGTDPEIWHPAVSTSTYLHAPGNDPRALPADAVVQKAAEILNTRRIPA